MWKPGQIVTIDGKRYRVVKAKNSLNACYECAFNIARTCKYAPTICRYRFGKVPMNCNLVEIKPKNVIG